MYSDNLRQLRKYLNMTVDEFAQKLNLPSRTIGGYERKERTPSIELAVLLNKIFNVNINWFLNGKGEMFLYQKNSLKKEHSANDEKIKSWGRRLQRIQTVNKMTDEEFAKIIDVSQSRLIDLCLNSKNPRAEELFKIKENFDVSLDWLLFEEGDANSKESQISSLGLSPEQLLRLKKILSD